MKKLGLTFIIAVSFLVGKSQEKHIPINKVTHTDSLISFIDLQQFYLYIRKSISVDEYEKLKPEGVLNALWDWKIKLLSDTTKKK